MNAPTFALGTALVVLSASAATAPANAATIAVIVSPGARAETLAASRFSSCGRPNTPAAIAGVAYSDMPEIARQQGVSGTSLVRVDLRSSGSLQSAALARSSGNRLLDDAAIATARSTRYTPEVRDCTSVGGSYLIVVNFTSSGSM